MSIAWILFLVAGLSFLFTGIKRRNAIARNLLDVPNIRSSHTVATPRGGGVAIVLSFLFSLTALFFLRLLSAATVVGFGGAGILVAFIGFLDDQGHIPARWRLLVHFIGAGWGVWWIGGFPSIAILGMTFDLGWIGYLLVWFYVVWLLNLYNFMDGIDGIASIEAITVCLGGALLFFLVIPEEKIWMVPLLLMSTVCGFLFWNFPSAKIFMGDVGSGFLGLMLGLMSVQAALYAPKLFWAWVILLGVFIVDATVTLGRRVLRGDKFYEAHRSHAYQIISRRFSSHKKVTMGVLLINVAWLFPWAVFSVIFPEMDFICVVAALMPLVYLAIKVGAGTTNE
ncbi:MAG: glycosyltransferase family 4 protein [Desulfobulbaceae bacterium]|nr:glycosyltransferase family 4 protein [Desulfobulbaceae bacterium]